eukprot:TRINITY_DN1626_c0_g1_i2.p1 TRINITY_DN1626_c0_g1~~TRINITY_DN1626_c0_g1_i2.p1  ORF type:complete len:221 (-),score=79.52 TRINITY_DN1626_c0_g1_i2:731-1393(-)
MSFSGFTEVEIKKYERTTKQKPKKKKPDDPRRSIKHVPLDVEEGREDDDKSKEENEEKLEEAENKEVLLEEPDLLCDNAGENEELRHLPVPLVATSHSDIEDENKKLKAMIEIAVKERKQRSVQEAEKLQQIQMELAKLDELVGNDVKIIRKDIEATTQQLSESRKRYERSEKEYVSAKLELHRHEERKNNLTDYLCFIITQNETRKSEKLHELMKELNF